jgi:hypothetical protein
MKLDYSDLTKRAWEIVWKCKFLWLFCFILATAAACSNHSNFLNYSFDGADTDAINVPTTTNIFIKSSWQPGFTDTDLQDIALRYNLLITDGYTYFNSKTEYLHQLNPSLKILAYINGLVVVKNSPDWDYITVNHPEWFLLDSKGNRINERWWPDNYLMDPRSEGWKQFRAGQLLELVNLYGNDGIFLDVITSWLVEGTYIYYSGRPVNPRTSAPYTNNEWRQDNYDYLGYMKQALGPAKLLIFNGISNGSLYQKHNSKPFLDNADGTMEEGFLRNGGDTIDFNKKEIDWKKDVDAVAEIADAGKTCLVTTVIYAGVQATDSQIKTVHRYGFSSYLLAEGPNTYYDFRRWPMTALSRPYDPLWSTPIGTPLAPYYKAGNIYQRDFTGGKVLVNPTDTGATYVLGLSKPYRNLDGQLVLMVSLAPKTGTILTKVAD